LNPEEYDLMYQVEQIHWWYRGMQVITEALLDRWLMWNARNTILDAGCGTGFALTDYLPHHGIVTGVDLSPLAVGYSQKRGARRLVRASILDFPFASSAFDLVVSFDVLYEDSVPDDRLAVREFARVLKTGGILLMRLPAYDWLRGRHDQAIHTARRYSRSQVMTLLEESGLNVQYASYANMFLFPLALIKRSLEKLQRNPRPASDLSFPIGPLNGLFQWILSIEAVLISRFPLPFGLSVIAVARKGF